MNCSKLLLLNMLLLSDTTVLGRPWVANIVLSFSIVVVVVTELTMFTSSTLGVHQLPQEASSLGRVPHNQCAI